MLRIALSICALLVGCTPPPLKDHASEIKPPLRQAMVASDDVPSSVAEKVRAVSENHASFLAIDGASRKEYIGTEINRVKPEDDTDREGRQYTVIHYLYDTDTTIYTTVSETLDQVIEQVFLPHVPTNLSETELARATELALSDQRVATALGDYISVIVVEPLLIRTSNKEDPMFDRRMVRLLFKIGRDYLSKPIVVVDLTHEEVLVQDDGELK